MMNSIDAEQTVIGGLLIEPRIKNVLATGLMPSDFSDKKLGTLFEYLIKMDEQDAHIDTLTTRDYIEQGGNKGDYSFPYLAMLSENCVGIANMDIYADHIRKTRITNDIKKLKNNIQYSNYQETVGAIQRLEIDLAKDEEGSMAHAVSKTIDYIEEIHTHGTGLSTGFQSIDSLLHGLRGGTVTVLAGRPSMGKSTLALNIANNISNTKTVLFYSLEMTQVQLMMKIVASETDINLNKVDKNQLTEEENDRFYTALSKAGNKNMTILDRGYVSVRDIVSKSRQMHGRNGLDCIVIDYLQLMKYDKNKEISELGNITRELKYLSKELDIPIILLSQLSRGVEQRENKRPLMSDLRSSGEIEQDADCVLLMHREKEVDPTNDDIICNVAKNRNGEVRATKLTFTKPTGRFSTRVETRLHDKKPF